MATTRTLRRVQPHPDPVDGRDGHDTMDLTSPLDIAIARWPALAELRRLEGWRWQYGSAQLIGEQWLGGPWLNALVIHEPDDAYTARLRVLDEDNHEVVWLAEGTVATVLGQLSLVPLPDQAGAPTEPRPLIVLPEAGGDQPWTPDR